MIFGGLAEGTRITTHVGQVPVESIAVGDLVTTRSGPRRVISVGVPALRRRCVDLSFDRSSVICAEDHRFNVQKQWVPAKDLVEGDLMLWGRGGHCPVMFYSPVLEISPVVGGRLVYTLGIQEQRGFMANGALCRAY